MVTGWVLTESENRNLGQNELTRQSPHLMWFGPVLRPLLPRLPLSLLTAGGKIRAGISDSSRPRPIVASDVFCSSRGRRKGLEITLMVEWELNQKV